MRTFKSANKESARARRRRLDGTKAKKAVLVGAAVATAFSVGLTPPIANAVSSNTYFVGFPDWLGIGDSSTLPADADAVEAAIRAAKDKNPLTGWGIIPGGVPLDPTWVQWYNPLTDSSYTPPAWEGTGEFDEQEVRNQAYYDIYDPAYDAAYDAAKAVDRQRFLSTRKLKDVLTPQQWNDLPGWVRALNPNSPFYNNPSLTDALLDNAGFYSYTIKNPFGSDYTVSFNLGLSDWDDAGVAAGLDAVDGVVDADGNPIKPTRIEYTEIMELVDGYWSTNTYGQWVSPTDDVAQLTDLLGLLAGEDLELSDLADMSPRDIAYYLEQISGEGDLGFLAPLVNWTTYLQNVNLIGYGDGAIAIGEAYRRILESYQNGEVEPGEARTDGLRIVLDPEGNPVLKYTNKTDGTFEFPLPAELLFPDAPKDENGNTIYPDYVKTEGGVIDITLLTMTLLRNPGRPNGGLYARFAPIYQELTGVNPVTPDREDVLPAGLDPDLIQNLLQGNISDIDFDLGTITALAEDANGKPILVTFKVDLTWEYDLLSDAPVTASPIAWANSAVASLLVLQLGESLMGGLQGDPESIPGLEFYTAPDSSFYGTLTTESLPLLSPIRLLAGAIGTATGEDINTPFADAFEPLLKTLTNVAYTDWERVENADGTISYDRTLDQMHKHVLFGTQTMTPVERAQLAGDVIAILGAGLGAEITDINGRFLARVEKLLGEIDAELPSELREAWVKSVPRLGNAITEVSAKLGSGVSDVLTDVADAVDLTEHKEIEAPSSGSEQEQTQLVSSQRDSGNEAKQAKPVAEGVASTDKDQGELDPVDADAELELVEEAAGSESGSSAVSKKRAQESLAKVRADLKEARDDVRADVKKATDNAKKAVKKAGDGIKKSVKDTTEKVKKAVTPKKKKVDAGDSDD